MANKDELLRRREVVNEALMMENGLPVNTFNQIHSGCSTVKISMRRSRDSGVVSTAFIDISDIPIELPEREYTLFCNEHGVSSDSFWEVDYS